MAKRGYPLNNNNSSRHKNNLLAAHSAGDFPQGARVPLNFALNLDICREGEGERAMLSVQPSSRSNRGTYY
jgi:hypothetical protein